MRPEGLCSAGVSLEGGPYGARLQRLDVTCAAGSCVVVAGEGAPPTLANCRCGVEGPNVL